MTATNKLTHVAIIVGIAVVVANVAFFVLSQLYADEHAGTNLDSARTAFAALTLITAALALATAVDARLVGHGLAMLTSLSLLVAGVSAIKAHVPLVLGVTQIVVGVILPALVYFAWMGKSRAAWAFEVALMCVFGIADFFGAPKLRTALHIGIWWAMIIPAYQVVAIFALGSLRHDYRD